MQVGEVRVAEDQDFDLLKIYLTRNDGWQLEYEKKSKLSVWSRPKEENNNFKMIRLKAIFMGVPAATLYDVLQDPIYKKTWDKYTMEVKEVGHVNPNNSIDYYSMYFPSPMKNRDFVVQNSWLETPSEYMIINHSVYHRDFPHRRGFVRGTSYFTGVLIKPIKGGCELGYVTHSDPGGKVSSWVSNKVSTSLAPRLVKKLYKASLAYPSWKQKHSPDLKKWLYPEQITSPKIDIDRDCVEPVQCDDTDSSPDEGSILEEDIMRLNSDDEEDNDFT